MDPSNNNLTITKITDTTPIFEALPKKITIKILGYLEKKDLFAICSSCKLLNEIGDSSPLWKEEIKFFRIDVKKYIENKISIKATVAENINRLQKFAIESDKLEDKEAEIFINLASMGYHLLMSPRIHNKIIFQNSSEEETYRKSEMNNIITLVFLRTRRLEQHKLRSITILEKYAAILLKYYGYYGDGEKAWATIAIDHISQNNPEGALEIANKELNGFPNEIGVIIKAVVAYYAEKNLLDKAIEVVKRYKETDKNFEDYHLDHCNSIILFWAEKFNNLFIIEEVIDKCLPEQDKFQQVESHIEKNLDLKNFNEADRLFVKYANVIASCENEWDVHTAIDLYVRLGHIDLAWKIALKHQENDDMVLCVLRNAFSSATLTEEEGKVQKMIDNNK